MKLISVMMEQTSLMYLLLKRSLSLIFTPKISHQSTKENIFLRIYSISGDMFFLHKNYLHSLFR